MIDPSHAHIISNHVHHPHGDDKVGVTGCPNVATGGDATGVPVASGVTDGGGSGGRGWLRNGGNSYLGVGVTLGVEVSMGDGNASAVAVAETSATNASTSTP